MADDPLLFRVYSSDRTTIYTVEAARTVGGVRFSCTCEAGQNHTLCHHRLSLLAGDAGSVVEGSEASFEPLNKLLRDSKIPASVELLDTLNGQMDDLKRKISAQKKAIARLMSG